MTRWTHALPLCVALTAPLPALAQEGTTPPAEPQGDMSEGMDLMQKGAELLFQGFLDQMEPALGDMAEAMKELEPRVMELLALIDDMSNYHAPELLENGDILIRRKTPAELEAEKGQDIEL